MTGAAANGKLAIASPLTVDNRRTKLTPHSTALNAAVLHMASRTCPTGYDVGADAPDSFPKLLAHFWKTGRIKVWDGASDDTLYADREVNYAFRAWHDWAHVVEWATFDVSGEQRACARQLSDLRAVYGDSPMVREWCALLDADCVGQILYHERTGHFPSPQRPFVLAYAACTNDNQRRIVLEMRWHEPQRANA